MAVGVASDLMRVIVGGHPDAPGAAEGITATLEPLEALFPVFRSESEDIAGAIPPERLPACQCSRTEGAQPRGRHSLPQVRPAGMTRAAAEVPGAPGEACGGPRGRQRRAAPAPAAQAQAQAQEQQVREQQQAPASPPALPAASQAAQPQACFLWLREGRCAYGGSCRFAHPAGHRGELAAQRPPRRRRRPERSGGGVQSAGGAQGGAEHAEAARSRPANRGKAGVFRRWLLDTFGGPSAEALRGAVLDVAGGRGDLAFELRNLNGVEAVVVDPRPGNCRPLHRKFAHGWFHRNLARRPWVTVARPERSRSPRRVRAFFTPELWGESGPSRRAMLRAARQLDAKGEASLPRDAVSAARRAGAQAARGAAPGASGGAECGDAAEMTRELDAAEAEFETALSKASLVVGLHPDEATDFILELARERGLPFALVPCCVHWKAFPGRELDGRPVRTVAQLVKWLQRRGGPGTQVASLDFEGQNTVVFNTRGALVWGDRPDVSAETANTGAEGPDPWGRF